jgi:DNA-binding response OmpR family regulator
MSLSTRGESAVCTESDETSAFRQCAASHELRLHRIHLPASVRASLQATVVFDCGCGLRWLMRAEGGGVVRALPAGGAEGEMTGYMQKPTVDRSGPSILCVDDDPGVLDLLKEYFKLQGFTVLTATNGVEAFLQVKESMPQALVMDLFMPRLGGIGALGRIKALNPNIVVILMSGMGSALDLITEAGLAVAGALTKPLNFGKLSEMLASAGVIAPSALPATAQRKRPVRARVLVVDDALAMRKMLAEHLEDQGYEVLEAADGEEALALMPEARPQIVLLDLMMDGIGGMETLRRIKAAYPATCVIMVTAIEEMDSAHTALGLGASDYVSKPFTMQYLDSVLEVHLIADRINPELK